MTQYPTQDQIERRADQIIEGIGYPHLPSLPGIAFRRLTLAERGEASRAYSRFLKEEMARGGRFSEALLATELRRRCLEVGIDYDELMAMEEEFQKRIFDRAPADLRDMAPRLTPEEFEALSDEEKEQYTADLQQRGNQVIEFLRNLFTPEEQIIRRQIDQVKELQDQLRAQSYEHHARVHQRLMELLRGARQADDLSKPYFASLDELYELEDTDQQTWVELADRWRTFRAGRWPGFTPPSSSAR